MIRIKVTEWKYTEVVLLTVAYQIHHTKSTTVQITVNHIPVRNSRRL